ncbi:HAD family hydrolase [Micromonospora avicenniae]|uniref:Haloacid dehalogenase superfamily, subfamily IA, variant 3 with third motif having DD or ED/haloacid dehalogenase superfamily, subfamily IA, variant 1 with third motif having Dx(3-4)D or Dx(3-4)E n=1 Tax=Micromonospora avicenniae TaxID=1198245 RepID=A0A1N7C7N8_9ACTN|nr:haloacid dehalogenase superfamily, subfamily IA, variant 3 with third motif having DD or ED/haloacid dehalogenase superfamily, subfamily IA, variant 1 with third motif having Dx(3-4)D or Dx(3-4)E [Micromonospora avicenniae]
MPEQPEPSQTPTVGGADAVAPRPRPSRRPVKAVLFDFHGTLAQVEEPLEWVLKAAATCGVTLDRVKATILADRLLTAGRAGGPMPARVPPRLAEHWSARDLYPHAHRAAYTGLAETVDAGIDGLADALYERLLLSEGWVPYPDTAPTIAALREAGIRVAVVSNIGFDLRPHFDAWQLTELVDAFVLSYEVGRCKPDPGIFLRACGMLGVDPEETLMVGDSPADAGAAAAGCAVLVLPAADPGRENGLGAVLDIALPT